MADMVWIEIAVIGLGVGFLGGLFGKGGSAVATPLLAAIGIPPIIAVASPLPATVPSLLAALRAYWYGDFVDGTVVRWTIAFGVPSTVVGAVATRWIGGRVLVGITDVIVAGLGLGLLLRPGAAREVVRDLG